MSCEKIACKKVVRQAAEFVREFLNSSGSQPDLSSVETYVNLKFVDATKIIPYSGTFVGVDGIASFVNLFRSYVQILSSSHVRPFVDSRVDNCSKVIVPVSVVQQNKRTLTEPFFPTPFNIKYFFTFTFNCRSLSEINIESDTSALALFYQYNTTPDPTGTYNKYKLLMVVGSDEITATSPLTFGTVAKQGFQTIIGLTPAQSEQYYQSAVSWFLTRFGVDFTNGINVGNDIIATPDFTAFMTPIIANNTYRIMESNNPLIPILDLNNPPKVTLVEYAVTFNHANTPPVTYTGTYAPAGYPSDNGDVLAFGIYKIDVPAGVFGPAHTYLVFMRNDFPGHADYLDGTPQSDPAHSMEHFQFYSAEFGPGAAALDVASALGPDPVTGGYRNLFRAAWAFPGSFAVPYYNTFTTPPVTL